MVQQATDHELAVRTAALPLTDDEGLDLVDVQVKGSGRRTLVRVVVDRKGGVDLATMQDVARRLSDELDRLEESGRHVLPDGYRLEVSSPGVDHPLRDQAAFDRVTGRDVRVQRTQAEGDIEHVEGTVRSAGPEEVVLDTRQGEVRVPYADIVKATQCLPW